MRPCDLGALAPPPYMSFAGGRQPSSLDAVVPRATVGRGGESFLGETERLAVRGTVSHLPQRPCLESSPNLLDLGDHFLWSQRWQGPASEASV